VTFWSIFPIKALISFNLSHRWLSGREKWVGERQSSGKWLKAKPHNFRHTPAAACSFSRHSLKNKWNEVKVREKIGLWQYFCSAIFWSAINLLKAAKNGPLLRGLKQTNKRGELEREVKKKIVYWQIDALAFVCLGQLIFFWDFKQKINVWSTFIFHYFRDFFLIFMDFYAFSVHFLFYTISSSF
jgi:hypothetical protein